MKQKVCFLALVALLLSPIGVTEVVEAEDACLDSGLSTVFISEIGWAGTSKSTADEWLELANREEIEIDVSGWIIEGASAGGSFLTLPDGAKIPPRSSYLIANYSAESDKSALAAPPNYVNTAISLSNSALRLVLKDKNGCQVDEAGDGGAPFFGGTGTEGTVSMVRLEPLINGILTVAWTAAEDSNGFDTNTNDKGAPGNVRWASLSPSSVDEPVIIETVNDEPQPLEPTIEETVIEESVEISAETPALENEIILEPLVEEILLTETINEETVLEVTTEPIAEEAAEQITDEIKIESEEPEPETEERSSFTVISYPNGALLINEFVSDPIKGEKEWVEIINPYNNVIPLDEWKISEASGRTAALPDILLGYGQVAVAEFSSSALNNDSDTLLLLDPNNVIIDEIIYGSADIPAVKDPNSVARNGEEKFMATETPTKGLMNIITTTIEIMVEDKKDGAVKNKASSTVNIKEITDENVCEKTKAMPQENPGKTETTRLSTIRLSELYPNTGGNDAANEFIELENYGSETSDLFGLTLRDAAGHEWSFADHVKLGAGKFLTINQTDYQFALNNSGSETLWLYMTEETLLDQIQYENAPKKYSLARQGDVWHWTPIITPNEPNTLPPTAELESAAMAGQNEVSIDNRGVDETESLARVSIEEARALPKDSQIVVEGIVSVEPGTLGKQIFYLLDNRAGIQIYKSDSDFPDLTIGDYVELSGTSSSSRGEPRVKIGREDEITVLENNLPLTALYIETISEEEAGQLVKTTGVVTEKSAKQMMIETDSGLVEIKIKNGTGIDLSEIRPGDKLTATGLVGQTENNFYLLPRSQDDIAVQKNEEIAPLTTVEQPTGRQIAEQNDQKRAIVIGLAVIGALAVYALRDKLRIRTKIYEKNHKLSPTPAG